MCAIRCLVVVVALTTGLRFAVAQDGAAPANVELSPRVERLLSWLPADTETLIVAQEAWTVRNLEEAMMELDPEEMGAAEIQEFLGLMFSAIPAGFLFGAEVPAAIEELDGKKILLALEGSRAFEAPVGMGGGSFEGCQFVLVEADAHAALDAIMKRCEENAARVLEHAGVKAYAVAQETDDGETTLYFCRPEEAMLMCATDEGYLKETLDRRNQEKHVDRALPSSLPEWTHVPVDDAVWGLRHYQETAGEEDRSSPRHARPAIPMQDGKAIGFSFGFDPESEVMATLVHLTPIENAVEHCRAAWSVVNPTMELKVEQVEPGAVRVSLPTTDPYSAGNCWAMVMAYFGHLVNF